MKHSPLARALAVLATAVLAHLPSTAGACTVCMGDVNSKMAPAMNAAIFLMLGCIGFMLASAAAFGIYLMKRASAPLPPHAGLTSVINSSEDPS
jgi:hypothetical protein